MNKFLDKIFNRLRSKDTIRAKNLIERLISENPRFHLCQGELTSWSVQADTLRHFGTLLTQGMTTIETGCGQTTVVFAITGTNHICVTPDAQEANRVEAYCAGLGLANRVTFVIDSSDYVLPTNRLIPNELDFVLIDGAHAFPAPIVDWHYTARRLKIHGILAVDDYKMPSVKILVDFLRGEDEWQFLRIVQNTAFFKKLRQIKDLVDWSGQKINANFPGY